MTDLFKIWCWDRPNHLQPSALEPSEWKALQDAARFQGCSGRRAAALVADETGHLSIIDSTGEAHAISAMKFLAVKP